MYEYDRVIADYYDSSSLGLKGDVDFYVEEAQRAGSAVFELGCGTGRTLIPTAQAGVEIVGLDFSPAMLEVARQRVEELSAETKARIELVQGDMRDFALERKFRLITIPYRAFLHMLTVDDQRRALRCIREHLADDGILVFNVFDPRLDIINSHIRGTSGEAPIQREFVNPKTGRRVIHRTPVSYEPESQIGTCNFTYDELDENGNVAEQNHSIITLRWVYKYEMEHLLELCGFQVEALYGDFTRGPFKYGGEQIWVCGKSPSVRASSSKGVCETMVAEQTAH